MWHALKHIERPIMAPKFEFTMAHPVEVVQPANQNET